MAGRIFHPPHGGIGIGYDHVVSEFGVSGPRHIVIIPARGEVNHPNLNSVGVVQALPASRTHAVGGEEIMRRLVGAKIIRIGGTDEADIEGGGLIIDYVCLGENATRRVVFGFNENGMWVEYEGYKSSSREAIQDGIRG